MSTIHVIDRDAAARLAARRVLERAGFAVTASPDAGIAPTSCPDLVTADLAAVSLSAIRRHYPATPVLALYGEGVAAGDMALLAGRLRKPFTPSQLLAAVRLCLARPGATTE